MPPERLFIAYRTIITKEITRFMRIWSQTILPAAISMALYFIIFGNLIGPRIGVMGGFSYMEFHCSRDHHDVDHQQRLFQCVPRLSSGRASSAILRKCWLRRYHTG